MARRGAGGRIALAAPYPYSGAFCAATGGAGGALVGAYTGPPPPTRPQVS